MNHNSCADAHVVLVIVQSIVECGQQVVGLDEAQREATVETRVGAAAEVGGEGCTGVACTGIGSLNQRSACMCQADQRLAEGLQR